MFTNRMKPIANKKTLLISALLLGAIILDQKSTLAQGEITVCPLDKMVTVGSLLDQSFFSVSNLLLEVDKVLANSAQAYQAATRLVQISKEDCKPTNCESLCQLEWKSISCPPDCPAGCECEWGTCHYYNSNDPCEIQICKEKDCSGQACPFGLIRSLVEGIAANRAAIEVAHQNIKDFFEKEISEFPKPDNFTIFGKFCEHHILSKLCKACPGVQLVLIDACKSEFYALLALQNKAMSNIKKCDIIKPDDLFQGRQGELLFRCKDVRPSPVKQCWQDDFFCCTTEE